MERLRPAEGGRAGSLPEGGAVEKPLWKWRRARARGRAVLRDGGGLHLLRGVHLGFGRILASDN